MLAAMEDLFDSWPGTLIVVSHDRYLVERITDQQYAILDGRLRHLPGGVDEYLRRRDAATAEPAAVASSPMPPSTAGSALSGAADRAARKEMAAAERALERLAQRVANIHERMASHDPGDFEGISRLNDELRDIQAQTATLEARWFALLELVG